MSAYFSCTRRHSAGGQFVTHVAALPGNPYDGHTLATVIPQIQALIGNVLDRCITDAGYRGHNAPPDYKFKVYMAGQKRRVTPQVKREFKRRRSSATSRNITAWAAITSPMPMPAATAQTAAAATARSVSACAQLPSVNRRSYLGSTTGGRLPSPVNRRRSLSHRSTARSPLAPC